VGLVLDAVDGAWYDYDDPNPVTLPIVEARTSPATIAPPAKVAVETESQASDIAPKVTPVHHLRSDPDARATWIQE
jgi:hypothetical protein